jgi:hypothetical protein
MTTPTFTTLARLQPALLDLLYLAGTTGRRLRGGWVQLHGWYDIRIQLRELIGWGAPEGQDSALKSCAAYDACYAALHRAYWGWSS